MVSETKDNKSIDKKSLQGHRERLRKKFFETGLTGFHDYEIVELLLTIGTPRKDCKPMAREMIKRFKTLHNIFEADPLELKSVNGIGEKNIFPLILIKSVAEIYLKKKILNKEVLLNSEDVFNYLYYSMRDKDVEIFKVIFLDSANRVNSVEDLHTGSISSSPVYPREIIKKSLNNKSSGLIFAHNHPSGKIKPSKSDIAITRRLVHSALYLDIKVHEHIIIGDNIYFSFADEGYIRRFTKEFYEMEKEALDE